jgi:Glycosyltransferase family 87
LPAKITWISIILGGTILFAWSLYRDINAERQYAGDLRNRVVGARIQKDGLSPYFYKWKKGDGIRYYDPNNFDSFKVANITASPFFHHALQPVADLPQSRFSVFWLLIEYLAFLLLLGLGIMICSSPLQRRLVLATAALFLLTEGWKMHIANGQNYIFIPLLAMAFYYTASKKQHWIAALTAGSCAVLLVLIKPNALLFFIPFVFLLRQYNRRCLIALSVPMLLAAGWILSSPAEIFLWKEYRANISQQVKVHQQEQPDKQLNDSNPLFDPWEGISATAIKKEAELHPQHIFSENGNVFVAARQLFHLTIGTRSLVLASLLSILLVLGLFLFRHGLGAINFPAAAFAGFSLYMISDLFSPVYRHQYYAVQWLFPLLLAAALYNESNKKTALLLSAGLLLNIVNLAFVPMEHSIGEYIMLLAIIVLSLRRQKQPTQ